ncbi:MAG: MFS transporter [Armatimonadetes bacterium]|nr:MFS transporter [Armatimonadota bacterium]
MKEKPVAAPSNDGMDKPKLFLLSVIALVTAGMVFSIRGGVLADLQKEFFEPINAVTAATMVTKVAGYAFLGFAVSVLIASPLCDFLGMGRLLTLAGALHILGTLATIFAPHNASANMVLSLSMISVGLAHGLVEAVINPLIATIYADDKTHRLNVLHAWWPGGIIIGGLISATPLPWQAKMASALIPAVIYVIMIISNRFPATERVQAGVSNEEMIRTAFSPAFILLLACMMLTASSELAPGQWVDTALSKAAGFKGILLLVYVSGLMFVMRHFAGSLAHRLSPIGLLWASCLMATLGLFMLSQAHSGLTAIVAATIWGIGVCYMWPTMLGVTSERFAKGGALALGLMGSVGNLAIYFALPAIGRVYDAAKVAAAGGEMAFKAAEAALKTGGPAAQTTMDSFLAIASTKSFQFVAMLPAVLIIVFGLWWLSDKAKGGYKAENLLADSE